MTSHPYTNTRYFYIDQLEAEWMSARHGMLFQDEKGNPTRPDEHLGIRDFERFYIHPDSLHLLEVQEGDWVEGWDEEHQTRCAYPYGEGWITYGTPPIIIGRDGKPFFWPESEAR